MQQVSNPIREIPWENISNNNTVQVHDSVRCLWSNKWMNKQVKRGNTLKIIIIVEGNYQSRITKLLQLNFIIMQSGVCEVLINIKEKVGKKP